MLKKLYTNENFGFYQGLQTCSFLAATFNKPAVLQSIGCAATAEEAVGDGACRDDVEDAGVKGIEYNTAVGFVVPVMVSSGFGDPGGVYGLLTCITNGDTLSISFRRCPRCVINFVPNCTSTPGVYAKHLDTSLAQCV